MAASPIGDDLIDRARGMNAFAKLLARLTYGFVQRIAIARDETGTWIESIGIVCDGLGNLLVGQAVDS